jgi:hypothetical protein
MSKPTFRAFLRLNRHRDGCDRRFLPRCAARSELSLALPILVNDVTNVITFARGSRRP